MDLENIMLSEISQTEKVKNLTILLICGIQDWKQQINKQDKQKNKEKLREKDCGGDQREGGGKVVKGKTGQIYGDRRWVDFG